MTFCITRLGEYRTRKGGKAVILGKTPTNIWIGYIGGQYADYWFPDGRYGGNKCDLDIVNIWEESIMVEAWLNVYPDGFDIHRDKRGAELYKDTNCIASKKIRWDGSKIIDVTYENR